tara:strand:+ start:26 stop:199 length:174 start_codon:yes stop_codon:yes gene_type:complete
MPATPGTSAKVELDPAIRLVSSETWDPFVGVEAGRTVVQPSATTEGAMGTDTIRKGN